MKRLLRLCVLAVAGAAITSVAQSLPALNIERVSDDEVRISWTNPEAETVLEEADLLTPDFVWRTRARAQSAGLFSVKVAIIGGTRFFRLRGLGTDRPSAQSRPPDAMRLDRRTRSSDHQPFAITR